MEEVSVCRELEVRDSYITGKGRAQTIYTVHTLFLM